VTAAINEYLLYSGAVNGGWDAIKSELAAKYSEGGYPQLKELICS